MCISEHNKKDERKYKSNTNIYTEHQIKKRFHEYMYVQNYISVYLLNVQVSLIVVSTEFEKCVF